MTLKPLLDCFVPVQVFFFSLSRGCFLTKKKDTLLFYSFLIRGYGGVINYAENRAEHVYF